MEDIIYYDTRQNVQSLCGQSETYSTSEVGRSHLDLFVPVLLKHKSIDVFTLCLRNYIFALPNFSAFYTRGNDLHFFSPNFNV